MNLNSVYCIAFSRIQADQMVQRLKGGAFSAQVISVIFAIGPLADALGDIVDGLRRQGIPMQKAKLYQGRVKEGRILVSVQAQNEDELDRAIDILSKAGGNDICATKEPTLAPQTPIMAKTLFHARQLSEPCLSIA